MKENGKNAIKFAVIALVFAIAAMADLLLGSVDIPASQVLESL